MKPTHCIANRALLLSLVLVSGGVIAAESLQGQVLGAGAPIANSTVTLWAATSGPPRAIGSGADRCGRPLFAERHYRGGERCEPVLRRQRR